MVHEDEDKVEEEENGVEKEDDDDGEEEEDDQDKEEEVKKVVRGFHKMSNVRRWRNVYINDNDDDYDEA